jgi:hypothetical protein
MVGVLRIGPGAPVQETNVNGSKPAAQAAAEKR